MTLPEKQKYLIATIGFPTADPGLALTPRTDGLPGWKITHIATGRCLAGSVSFATVERGLEVVAQAYVLLEVPWDNISDDGRVYGFEKGVDWKVAARWETVIYELAEEEEVGS
jgi:hypothetical protein